jgi:hypothetical protein
MKTVNSLSGGKTSSFIAMNYPADLELFSLVCIDDHNAGGKLKKDKATIQKVNDRLQKYCSHQKPFVATAEDPKTIYAMLDLEQLIGREIVWLRGAGFGEMMDIKKAIPNIAWRFCTTEMKMKPIFEHLLMYHELPVKMRIGYRYDEVERMSNFTDTFKYSYACNTYGTKQHKWKELMWREGDFPLIDNKIFHKDILDFWANHNIDWPLDSNCQNCFWKQPQQLRKNHDTNPAIMMWAAIQEIVRGNRFKKEISMLEAKNIGLQHEFNFGTGSGCQAGFCTD